MPGPNDELLFWEQLKPLVPFSRPTVTSMERQGRFPRRVEYGARVAWWRSEIQEWRDNLPRRDWNTPTPQLLNQQQRAGRP